MEQAIKQFARERGADLVGITSVERLAEAPAGSRPEDSLKGAKSVISLAKCFPAGALFSRPANYGSTMLSIYNYLDHIAVDVANYLEQKGGRAIPMLADAPYDHWEVENTYGRGNLSHKHAAQAAGLGRMGKNTLLLTPAYGNRVLLASVITDLALEPDPLVQEEFCIDGCTKCIEACPVKAIAPGKVTQKLCRTNVMTKLPRGKEVYGCWECRKACPR
ncbi:MAG: epoxyqueuosine reductase [Desulfobacteraceae bacterium]|nr:MAG: epoxyqueuosine reductase [Desulfobacteraceae bacterium]